MAATADRDQIEKKFVAGSFVGQVMYLLCWLR